MPKCSNSSPSLKSINKYLPRLRTPRTLRLSSVCGSAPSGQRKGLPSRTASMRAPAMRSAKLRRVTSTSGNSGMAIEKINSDSRFSTKTNPEKYQNGNVGSLDRYSVIKLAFDKEKPQLSARCGRFPYYHAHASIVLVPAFYWGIHCVSSVSYLCYGFSDCSMFVPSLCRIASHNP